MAGCDPAAAGEAVPDGVGVAADPAEVYGFNAGATLGKPTPALGSGTDFVPAEAAPANLALALTLVNLGTIGAYRFFPEEVEGVPACDVPEVRSARSGWGATLPKPGFRGGASTGVGEGRAAARYGFAGGC